MTAQAQPYKCREQPARQQEVTTTGAKRGAPRETRAPGKSGRSELTNEMRKTGPQGQTETDGWKKGEGGGRSGSRCMQADACVHARDERWQVRGAGRECAKNRRTHVASRTTRGEAQETA